jgi:hypothetical protein
LPKRKFEIRISKSETQNRSSLDLADVGFAFPLGPSIIRCMAGADLTPMNEPHRPHAMNVAGPFYVEDGCCTACDVPFLEAPGLFAYDDKNHCYVKRQPGTNQELNQMLRTAWASEVQCIRYRGKDAEIIRRLAELGGSHLCDIAPPATIQPVFRNIVTFDAASSQAESMTPANLARAFQDYLSSHNQGPSDRFTPTVEDNLTARFSYSWFEDNFHPIEFRSIKLPDCRWLIQHSSVEKLGSRSVSNQLDDWLKNDDRFCSIRWYSQDQWHGSQQWQETPW